jgi:hypothetical protein
MMDFQLPYLKKQYSSRQLTFILLFSREQGRGLVPDHVDPEIVVAPITESRQRTLSIVRIRLRFVTSTITPKMTDLPAISIRKYIRRGVRTNYLEIAHSRPASAKMPYRMDLRRNLPGNIAQGCQN